MRDPRPASPAKIRRSLLLCLAFTLLPLAARAVTVGEIPSPRPAGWSVDLTGQVPKETLAEIDRVAEQVKASHGGELAVAVVGTTQGIPSRAFATRLFNAWRIGERGKDDGVLLFVALDDHKAEIVLGNGLASPSLREESASILKDEMVPLLRQGHPGGAVLAGARACARHLLDTAPAAPAVPADVPATAAPAEPAPLPSSQPPAALPAAAVATVPVVPASDPSLLRALLAILVFVALGALGYGGYKLATRPRPCPKCSAPMARLSPEEGQAALPLTPIEETEVRLGSVTIEVYRCSACGALDKVSRRHLFSGYASCPKCTAVALSKQEQTLRQATYDYEGLVQTEWHCLYCSYQDSATSTTPRLVRPVERDDSSSTTAVALFSSSDSSSSSSSSADSSSGSDSGFGGGSSSGDGASASW